MASVNKYPSATGQVLSVRHLSASFRRNNHFNPAIKDISFELKPGKTLAIVGESGSGKSVTSLAIMGLLPNKLSRIDAGRIQFGALENNLLEWKERQMEDLRGAQISMIFQEPMTALNPVLKCGKQVQETLERHLKLDRKKAKSRVLSLFQSVRLPDPLRAYHSYPHELSGGQKQRVMIAMALGCSPDILIADEPTTALDVTVQREILELIKTLQKETGTSVIFITHDLGVVQDIADDVLVMYKGEVVEYGRKEALFSQPKHPYTIGLLNCRPPTDRRLLHLPTISDFIEAGEEAKNLSFDVESGPARKGRLAKLYAQNPVLEIKNLCKTYTQRQGFFKPAKEIFAVDQVSFDVYPGETLGLVGESGCGKTTLSRAILQLIKASSGQVIFHGQDLAKLDKRSLRDMRRHLQIIFQDPYSSLNPRMTVGQAILEPMQNFGIGRSESERLEKAYSLLKEVGLPPEVYHRFPHEFSGGQRQRIVIARTLATDPKFIICDESVSALDVSVQAQVLNLLNALKAKYQLTYIFISHDLSVVKHMSDRIVVMHKGSIAEIGEADALFDQPKSPYTQMLINSIPGKA